MLWLRTSGRASSTVRSARFVSLEIGNQHFDAAAAECGARVSAIVCAKCAGAAIRQVVAIDRRDDDVRELHGVDGARDVGRLERIGRLRRAVR